MQRRGQAGEGLTLGDDLARHAALRNRAHLDRKEGLARSSIEQEQVSHLGRLGESRDAFAPSPSRMGVEHGLRGNVVVPQVVMHGLEIPRELARADFEGDDGARITIESVTLAAVVVGRRIAHR